MPWLYTGPVGVGGGSRVPSQNFWEKIFVDQFKIKYSFKYQGLSN